MSESKESCRGRGKLKAVQCYARRTAHGVKRGLERFSDYTHRQSGEHRLAYAVAVLLVAGTLVGFGSVFLLQATITNPTATQVTYSRTYTLANGTVILENGRISGTFNCVVQPSASAVTEVGTWTIPQFSLTFSLKTPYWVTAMELNVYSGQQVTGTPVQTVAFTVGSTTYTATMQKWVNDYLTLITNNPADKSKWVLGDSPTINPTWTANFDTRDLANGVYTFQVAVAWGIGVPMLPGITVPSPPSLASTSSKAYFLSFFGLGEDVPVPEELKMPIVFIGIVAAIAVVAVILRRR